MNVKFRFSDYSISPFGVFDFFAAIPGADVVIESPSRLISRGVPTI